MKQSAPCLLVLAISFLMGSAAFAQNENCRPDLVRAQEISEDIVTLTEKIQTAYTSGQTRNVRVLERDMKTLVNARDAVLSCTDTQDLYLEQFQ